jgi:hypothetical protein
VFLIQQRPYHVSGQGKKVLTNTLVSRTGPVLLESQKEKKQTSKQSEVIFGQRKVVLLATDKTPAQFLEALI